MRRLGRHLFTICSAVSLLLCLTIVSAWVHSGFRRAVCGHVGVPDAAGAGRGWEVGTARGRVFISVLRYTPGEEPLTPGYYGLIYRAGSPRWMWVPEITSTGFGAVGFHWEHRTMPKVGREAHSLAVPYWFLLLVSLALPIHWWRRRRRPLPGHCRVCGYDLRASPQRCPECGAAAT
jgi:hypothetical protein